MRRALRRITIVLGLLTVYGFATAVLGYLSNFAPHYVSGDYRGSVILLDLITSLPAIVGAVLVGVVSAASFEEIGTPEVAALTGLIAFWYAGSLSSGWHVARMDPESLIGWFVSVVLVAGSCVTSHIVCRNRLSARAHRNAA